MSRQVQLGGAAEVRPAHATFLSSQPSVTSRCLKYLQFVRKKSPA